MKLFEALDFFKNLDVIKLDPDRIDSSDVANAILPTLIRMSYVNLLNKKVKYDRSKKDDDEEFEFDKLALENELDNVIESLIDKLQYPSKSSFNIHLEKIKFEFPVKLD